MLTVKQKNILVFVKDFVDENGISPSMDEIRSQFKLKAVSTVHEHIEALRAKGYLNKTDNVSRSVVLKKAGSQIVSIRLIGTIAAGEPIEVYENNNERISILDNRIKNDKNFYALRVRGSSMIDDGIFDGDIVVIKKQSVAENGQTVVAIIDENCATLKKIYKEKNRYRLEPRNQAMLPLFRKDVEIRGVVFQVIRQIDDKCQPVPNCNSKKIKTLDLFAGIGGVRLGFEKAGFKTVFSNDFEPNCKITYDLNFSNSKLVIEDIRKIGIDDLPSFDFLLGGFPCQAFSVAGYREGFNDKKGRGNLFFSIAKILAEKKPLGFMLENVKNLKTHDGGKTFKIIKETLEGLGYHLKTHLLNSMHYGNIPQNRERIFIIGFLDKGACERFAFPERIPLTKSVNDCFEENVDQKYYYNDKPLYEKLKKQVVKKNTIYQWRRKYVRENKNNVCPTLTANMGMGGHNVPIVLDHKGIRKLTPAECARFQGFPDNYKLPNLADSHLYKQIGNSVTVAVISRIAENIMRALK